MITGSVHPSPLSPVIASLASHRPCISIAVSIRPAPRPLRAGTSGRPMNQTSPAPKTAVYIQCDGIDASVRTMIVAHAAPTSPNEFAAPMNA
jgi:hypothetical protein